MTYHYTMCGLDYVHLMGGYRTRETEYGVTIAIEDADELDRAIATAVILSQSRLRGQEVKFLRSMIDVSQTELANQLGVKRITVARWEGAPKTPIPGPADRLIRLVICNDIFGGRCLELVMDSLSEITDKEVAPLYMHYVPDDKEPTLFSDKQSTGEGWTRKDIAV